MTLVLILITSPSLSFFLAGCLSFCPFLSVSVCLDLSPFLPPSPFVAGPAAQRHILSFCDKLSTVACANVQDGTELAICKDLGAAGRVGGTANGMKLMVGSKVPR